MLAVNRLLCRLVARDADEESKSCRSSAARLAAWQRITLRAYAAMASVRTNQILGHFDSLQEEDVQTAKLIVAASSCDQPAKEPSVPERYRRPRLLPAGRGRLLNPSTAGFRWYLAGLATPSGSRASAATAGGSVSRESSSRGEPPMRPSNITLRRLVAAA